MESVKMKGGFSGGVGSVKRRGGVSEEEWWGQ